MRFNKTAHLVALTALIGLTSLPTVAYAGPTLKAVPKGATTKHFIQMTPGMQRTAFESKSGVSKKQFIASLNLSSKKQRPH